MRSYILALLGAALLLGGAEGGCGALNAGEVPPVDEDGGAVNWVGVDSRPLAVGSNPITLGFEAVEGSGCCQAGYEVESTDPTILAVEDLGNQTVSVKALAAGSAEVEIFGSGEGTLFGTLPLTAAIPTAISFYDPSHLAVGIEGDTSLPSSFSLLESGTETLQAVITDAAGESLASQGLATGSASSPISVVKEEPEQFVLSALPGGQQGSFSGGLVGGSSSFLTYQINLVDSPSSVTLEAKVASDGSTLVLAKALAFDGSEVLGVPVWIFALQGPGTALPLAPPAAIKVLFPDGTAPGSATLLATAGAGLTAQISLPLPP